MITFLEIAREIASAISRKFPDDTVYIEACPQDFKRPSFLVALGAVASVPAAKRLVEVTAQFVVKCYPSLSEGHRLPELDSAFGMRTGIIELFTGESLPVGDRWLTFNMAASGYDQDGEAYVDLRTVFLQGSAPPIPGGGSSASSDLMRDLKMDINDRA